MLYSLTKAQVLEIIKRFDGYVSPNVDKYKT